MAALPQRADFDDDQSSVAAPTVMVFRALPSARPAGYYRNRPLIHLRCPQPPALPPRPSDPPQIQLVAPIPGLDELDDYAEVSEFAEDSEFVEVSEFVENSEFAEDSELDEELDPVDIGFVDDELEPDELDDELDDDELDPDDLDYDDVIDDDLTDEDVDPDEGLEPGEPAENFPTVNQVSRTDEPAVQAAAASARDHLPLLLTAVIVVVVILLGVAGALVVHAQSNPKQTRGISAVTPVGADANGQATAWALANLPGSTKLLADPATQTVLIGQGYPSSNISAVSNTSTQTAARYVIVTPAVRQAAIQPGTPLAQMLAEALPVAVFGDGVARVEVSQLGAMGTSLTTAQQARLMAGQALQRNPGLHVTAGLSSTVADGRLDMRAETLLAVLANQVAVTLTALPQSAAESRAGAPVRTVAVRLGGDPAVADKLFGATVAAMAPDMAPYQSSHQPDGSYRIVWLPDLALTPPVN